MKHLFSIAILWAGLWTSILGCATSQERPAPKDDAGAYYPLGVGNRWVFRASSPSQTSDTFEVRIDSRDAEGFYVSSQGARMMRRASGIFDGDRFVIEEPLEVGHEWMAVPSASAVERFRIVGMRVPVSVPAGSFSDCLQVEMSQTVRAQDGRSGRLVGIWTYAKNVGPVHFKQWVELPGAENIANVEFQLLEFDVQGAVGDKENQRTVEPGAAAL